MSEKKEVDYYLEIAERTERHLTTHLTPAHKIAFSLGSKSLASMVNEIESKLDGETVFHNQYIPPLELDILLGVKSPGGAIELCLIEVKYDKQLKLAHYSQLLGYLMVAKKISNGLLFLVEKNQTGAVSLSNDFNDIIKMKYLPMNWHSNIGLSEKSSFRVGICSLTPGNGIHWVDSKLIGGIYSFQDISSVLG
jgi:hypothetical protein